MLFHNLSLQTSHGGSYFPLFIEKTEALHFKAPEANSKCCLFSKCFSPLPCACRPRRNAIHKNTRKPAWTLPFLLFPLRVAISPRGVSNRAWYITHLARNNPSPSLPETGSSSDLGHWYTPVEASQESLQGIQVLGVG